MFGFEVKAERFTSLRANNVLIAHGSISLHQALGLGLWLAVRKSSCSKAYRFQQLNYWEYIH